MAPPALHYTTLHYIRPTSLWLVRNTNTKYTCDTGQTRNKLLAQWVHLPANHAANEHKPNKSLRHETQIT
jgi:hypothetical protein